MRTLEILQLSVGTYTISSNTVTGLSFSGSGTAVAGTQLILLNARNAKISMEVNFIT